MRFSTAFAVSARCRCWNSLTQFVTVFTMSLAVFRAALGLLFFRSTRSARLTIFIFFSDITYIWRLLVIRINELTAGKFRPDFGLFSGKVSFRRCNGGFGCRELLVKFLLSLGVSFPFP